MEIRSYLMMQNTSFWKLLVSWNQTRFMRPACSAVETWTDPEGRVCCVFPFMFPFFRRVFPFFRCVWRLCCSASRMCVPAPRLQGEQVSALLTNPANLVPKALYWADQDWLADYELVLRCIRGEKRARAACTPEEHGNMGSFTKPAGSSVHGWRKRNETRFSFLKQNQFRTRTKLIH